MTAFVVVLALICSRVAVTFYKQHQQTPAAIEAQLLADPEFGELGQAWKAGDPESFHRLTARISAGASAGQSRDSIVEAACGEVMAAAQPRLRNLADADVVAMIQSAAEAYRQLGHTHPSTCQPMFMGQPFGDITPYLSEDMRRRAMHLIAAAFRAGRSAGPTLEGDAFDAKINELTVATRSAIGEDINLLAPDAVIAGKEARYCEVAAALFETMTAMPEPEAASLRRGMWASAQ